MAEKHEEHRERHRADFAAVTGHPFSYFHCPITDRDEAGNLCLGHIVPDALGGSSPATVLQGAEVDAFYGSVVECDMVLVIQSRSKSNVDIFFDPKLSRAVGPQFYLNGQQLPYYEWRGHHAPGHTPAVLKNSDGASREIVFATSEEVIAGFDGTGGEIVVDRDFTYVMIAGLLKAAHLTLFRMLGYSYALSPGGRLIGKDVLGRFFDDFRGKPSKARPELENYFREWRNAVRPIASVGANDYRGTVDDGSVLEIRSSSGPPFAIGVFIRTNDDFHLVIVPGNDTADSLATYLSFVKSPPSSFAAKHVRYNRESKCWETNRDEPIRFDWPTDE